MHQILKLIRLDFHRALVICFLAYRVNHRLAFYKRADEPFIEAPTPYHNKQGWLKNQNNFLEPIREVGPILPSALINIICSVEREPENEVFIELDDFGNWIEKEDADFSTN